MMIIHVYDVVANDARGLFPNHVVRGDLRQMIDRLEDNHMPQAHGDFVSAGFMNFITHENA